MLLSVLVDEFLPFWYIFSMQLTTRGRYAVRAMLDLALHSNSEPVSLRQISGRQSISEKYLEQLFRNLRTAGLIRAIRGARGGYVLGRKADAINVGEILLGAGECLTPVDCLREESSCARRPTCVLRPCWKELNCVIRGFLESITLSDLCAKTRNGGADG
jgi:Rrf2 family iron-sulfur cluster assembly transcriptional regulator